MKKAVFYVLLLSLSLCAEVLVPDDFESGTGNWLLTGEWGLESGVAVSGNYSLSESPTGNYTGDEVSIATWTASIDLRNYTTAGITFQRKYMIENGFDYMYFEVSDDDGLTWNRLKSWTGLSDSWIEESVSLYSVIGYEQVKFRFNFQSDASVNLNGMNIDDLFIYTVPESHETFLFHSGPEFYEAPLGEHESYFECYDLDGIDSTWVEYNTDGTEAGSVCAFNDIANIYTFTIPTQVPGVVVDYRICVMEGSVEHIIKRTDYYTYIWGDYCKYDSGIVDYYLKVGNNDACAVKFTGYEAGLASVLIRNYYNSIDGIVSADMKCTLWYDDNGVPGEEITSASFTISPQADDYDQTAFTIIDYRNNPVGLNGDLWIGFTAPYGDVYTTLESVNEPEVPAYERAFRGTWTGDSWMWEKDSRYNYHIRAVFEIIGDIDDTLVPASSELYQNYPNPFNPTTEISYALKSEGQVTLSVFNTKGELVRSLVNEKKPAGNHSVNFSGEGLNSGVYFYRLNVDGNVTGSKRMLLIK